MEGDILAEINNIDVRKMCHSDVVQVLKDCARNKSATIVVERMSFPPSKGKGAGGARIKKEDLKLDRYRPKTLSENNSLLMESSQNSHKLSDCSNSSLKQRNVELYSLDNYNVQQCYSRSQSPGNELDRNDSWNRKPLNALDLYKHPPSESNYMTMAPRSNNSYYGSANSEVNDSYFYSLANSQRKEGTSFEHEQPLPMNGDMR